MNYDDGRSPFVKCFDVILPVIGRIKAGRKGAWRDTKDGKSKYQLPEKLDHYLLTKVVRKSTKEGEDQNFIEDTKLMESLSKDENDKLTTIPIKLVYNDITLSLRTYLTCYLGRTKLLCFGDGEIAFRINEKGERDKTKCPCRYLDKDNKQKNPQDPPCKINTKLFCMVEGQKESGGVWMFHSSSYWTGKEMPGALFWIASQTKGTLAGLRLNLVLTKRTTKHGATYVSNIRYPGDPKEMIAEASQIAKDNAMFTQTIELQETVARKQLLSRFNIENIKEAEIEEIVDEFYPEEAEKDKPITEKNKPTIDGDEKTTKEETKPEPKPVKEKKPSKKELTEAYYKENMIDICLVKPFGGVLFKDLKKEDKDWVYERMTGKGNETSPPTEEKKSEVIDNKEEVIAEEVTKSSSPTEEEVPTIVDDEEVTPEDANFIEVPEVTEGDIDW